MNYFLDWLVLHPWIGFLLVILLCLTVASAAGSIGNGLSGRSRGDD
jgi:hypothetical protein